SQRRMDLEQEVAELKQQLGNEQMVHHILERALHAPTNSSNSARSVLLNIPAFIPAKAKQLLAELVLVEEEITRLESQIHTMKGGLTLSQQQRASISMASNTYSYPEVAPEIKSMFFISQAMNAEYLQRHLAATATDDKPAKSPRDQARGSSGAAAVSPKLNAIGASTRKTHQSLPRTFAAGEEGRAEQGPAAEQAVGEDREVPGGDLHQAPPVVAGGRDGEVRQPRQVGEPAGKLPDRHGSERGGCQGEGPEGPTGPLRHLRVAGLGDPGHRPIQEPREVHIECLRSPRVLQLPSAHQAEGDVGGLAAGGFEVSDAPAEASVLVEHLQHLHHARNPAAWFALKL
uniref:Ternary complex factor MIP1 leucine-zipper domain-containing protein n=1 Tax=Aegilops tauschii subsp. strangulata TaxID=200361 RepID=A0A453MK10_AEGTS